MIKRVLFVSSITVLSALLLFGAVNRSLVKATPMPAEGNGQFHGQSQHTDEVQTGLEKQSPGQEFHGAVEQPAYEDHLESPAASGEGLAMVVEEVALRGEVISMTEDELTLDVGEEDLLIEGRTWSYAREQGFNTRAGNTLVLNGFYDDQTYEVIQITDETSGQTITVRDESGRPLWAGQGRGKGQNRRNGDRNL